MWRNGSRTRLKILRGRPRVGSSPTIRMKALIFKAFIFCQKSTTQDFTKTPNQILKQTFHKEREDKIYGKRKTNHKANQQKRI